ncbi:MAG: hypothetical protein LBB84_09920 [Tannerellaceae bacterium]|jgi:hypothetical protein|nr:hypothetical protein [Tannerellaceae bacterium]
MQLKTIYLILALALLVPTGCADNNEEQEVTMEIRELFLGKWKEIARGNDLHPKLEPDGHIIEFLPDDTYHAYFDNGEVSTSSYRIDAEFMYYDGGTPPSGFTYRYGFSGTDTLRLDYVTGNLTKISSTPLFNIYKRINTP